MPNEWIIDRNKASVTLFFTLNSFNSCLSLSPLSWSVDICDCSIVELCGFFSKQIIQKKIYAEARKWNLCKSELNCKASLEIVDQNGFWTSSEKQGKMLNFVKFWRNSDKNQIQVHQSTWNTRIDNFHFNKTKNHELTVVESRNFSRLEF